MKRLYWLKVDPKTGNSLGSSCWATYPGDKPDVGYYILVEEVEGIDNSITEDKLEKYYQKDIKGPTPQEKSEEAYQRILAMQEANRRICEIGCCIHKEHQK